jgi:hypothetical protein
MKLWNEKLKYYPTSYLFLFKPNDIMTMSHFDFIISSIARTHHKSTENNFCFDEDFRKNLIEYANKYKAHIEDILASIGYNFITCDNYSPFDEVMSIIKGEPYFRYIVNEINSDKKIEVCYYKHLLNSPVFYVNQFINGNYYGATFDDDGEFLLSDDVNFELKRISTRLTKWGYIISCYQVFDKN